MGIKLQTTPSIKHTSEFSTALVDSDLIAFAVASASDGHIYRVINPEDHLLLFEHRYMKDIKAWFKDNKNVPTNWLIDDYEPEDITTVLHSAKKMTTSILEDIGAKEYKLYLTGEDNFRYKINPLYKANRIGVRKPFHLQNVRDYLVKRWGAKVINGWEADDQIGIDQDTRSPESVKNTVACSIDKDFNCFPGWHYNWPHHGKDAKLYYVSPDEARFNFYSQVLVGDRTDNIEGIFGMGKKTADKLIKASNLSSNEDLYNLVVSIYQWYKCPLREGFRSQIEWAKRTVLKTASQIWIMQKEGEMWKPPITTKR